MAATTAGLPLNDVAALSTELDPAGWSPPAEVVSEDCKMSTTSANQCGQTGSMATCVPSTTCIGTVQADGSCDGHTRGVRLSSYPQGRIEIYNEDVQGWGTVCGHWLWDNDAPADIVCRQLGYSGGVLYTYGAGAGTTSLHPVFGYRRCTGTEANLFDCEEHVSPADRDCRTAGPGCAEHTMDPQCTHELDLGALCFNEGESPAERVQCQVHNAADSCDEWHGCTDGCQKCSGRSFVQVSAHPQDVFFGCVSFETTQCVYDITGSDGSYQHALREFALCSAVSPQPEGYCRASLASAMYLRNGDVCVGGASSDIGFHIRIPF
eukprot:COSAG02_NODE_15551_length_1161_cov_0.677966_2_plen_321_part_01